MPGGIDVSDSRSCLNTSRAIAMHCSTLVPGGTAISRSRYVSPLEAAAWRSREKNSVPGVGTTSSSGAGGAAAAGAVCSDGSGCEGGCTSGCVTTWSPSDSCGSPCGGEGGCTSGCVTTCSARESGAIDACAEGTVTGGVLGAVGAPAVLLAEAPIEALDGRSLNRSFVTRSCTRTVPSSSKSTRNLVSARPPRASVRALFHDSASMVTVGPVPPDAAGSSTAQRIVIFSGNTAVALGSRHREMLRRTAHSAMGGR